MILGNARATIDIDPCGRHDADGTPPAELRGMQTSPGCGAAGSSRRALLRRKVSSKYRSRTSLGYCEASKDGFDAWTGLVVENVKMSRLAKDRVAPDDGRVNVMRTSECSSARFL